MQSKHIFYLKYEGTHYWATPSWGSYDCITWTRKRAGKDEKWHHDVPFDDIPKDVQVEYMLWLMQLDKH